MHRTILSATVALASGVLLPLSVIAQAPRHADSPAAGVSAAPVIEWDGIARDITIPATAGEEPAALVHLGAVHAAIYDAIVAITGGYEPYGRAAPAHPGASIPFAVGTAARRVLLDRFPEQAAAIDRAWGAFIRRHASFEQVAHDPSIHAGIEVGGQAAALILASREGDGSDADLGFTMPPAAPGIWQPAEGQSPMAPWMADLRPFLLDADDQFLPPPPVALTSEAWTTELEDVKALGGATSTTRTAEQTRIARFFDDHPATQINDAVTSLIDARGLDVLEASRLYAMADVIAADALIACMDAGYTYAFWRPEPAIALAGLDGNDGTHPDTSWTPLLASPPAPAYPAQRACLAGAFGEVLRAALGSDRLDLVLRSRAVPGEHRAYPTVTQLVEEATQAGVWGGIDFPGAAATGRDLGRSVARFGLERAFRPDVSVPLLP
jgi:hypothetical protein